MAFFARAGLAFWLLTGACSTDRTASAGAEPSAVAELGAEAVAPVQLPASAQRPVAQPAVAAPAATSSAPALAAAADACPSGFHCDYAAFDRTPSPAITAVRVEKAAHRLHLIAGDTVVRSYSVALGYGGAGPKQMEGDAVTPVGEYKITGKLDKSPWHTLLGVSYPNYEDVKRFARLKAELKIPATANIGYGIAIHGRRDDMQDGEHKKRDWTLGCVALDNAEIDEVAKVVKAGTPVTIVD